MPHRPAATASRSLCESPLLWECQPAPYGSKAESPAGAVVFVGNARSGIVTTSAVSQRLSQGRTLWHSLAHGAAVFAVCRVCVRSSQAGRKSQPFVRSEHAALAAQAGSEHPLFRNQLVGVSRLGWRCVSRCESVRIQQSLHGSVLGRVRSRSTLSLRGRGQHVLCEAGFSTSATAKVRIHAGCDS